MADQCIICLETLDPSIPHDEAVVAALSDPAATASAGDAPPSITESVPADSADNNNNNHHHHRRRSSSIHNYTAEQQIACINPCGHILHDECLRAWIQKANSCPICRQAFNLVEVYDKAGGTKLSEYEVADKKQVAEFDPTAWLEEQAEEEESTPCPICGRADQEDVLLLCDACDAPYHTHCIGLDRVPRGAWFCMECEAGTNPIARRRQPRTFAQRTQAQVRRASRRARSDEWQDAWSVIAGRVWDALNLDLDSLDDDDSLSEYREHQRSVERQRQEFQQWQQRINIAGRQGARDAFRHAARPMLIQETPEPTRETAEERQAWNDFEKAQELDIESSSARKRKRTRSVTASPAEPSVKEPERKLKRPRRRRLVPTEQPHDSSSEGAESSRRSHVNGTASSSNAVSARPENAPPSFLASLLKEVELAPTTPDDESTRGFFNHGLQAGSPSIEHSSPAVSPTSSNFPTPRALSSTPPPHSTKTPGSPLPLTSHVMPIYHHADYSPNRASAAAPAEQFNDYRPRSPVIELRHPRPQRRQEANVRSPDTSPTRANMSSEAKEGINKIVKKALEPHWKSEGSTITKDQYAIINRSVSRMLYDRIPDPYALDDSSLSAWEKIAAAEVTKAVEGLSA